MERVVTRKLFMLRVPILHLWRMQINNADIEAQQPRG